MQKNITQLYNLEPKEILSPLEELNKKVEKLLSNQNSKYILDGILTRQEVANLLKVDLSTIHNWCKAGKLISYGIGARVYFKRKDIENALVLLNRK
ncbi:MAG: excisionase family DNA binding protein [Planctomycetota bacterium]|jgi:excisionase family DNA binding protein